MPSGEQVSAYDVSTALTEGPLSAAQREELSRVVQLARTICGLGFGIYVGPLEQGRDSAVAQHAVLPDAAAAVLVAVDPSTRSIEIVTGIDTTSALDDQSCRFAVLAMTSCFVADDLVGGLREGVMLLAHHARTPRGANVDEVA